MHAVLLLVLLWSNFLLLIHFVSTGLNTKNVTWTQKHGETGSRLKILKWPLQDTFRSVTLNAPWAYMLLRTDIKTSVPFFSSLSSQMSVVMGRPVWLLTEWFYGLKSNCGHYPLSVMAISLSIPTRCLLTAAIHTLLWRYTEGTECAGGSGW